jgi:hypothetical protein
VWYLRGDAWSYFNGQLNSADPKFARCGTWLGVSITRLASNPEIVYEFTVSINDFSAVRDSKAYISDVLTKGAAGITAGEQSKAAANKPKL